MINNDLYKLFYILYHFLYIYFKKFYTFKVFLKQKKFVTAVLSLYFLRFLLKIFTIHHKNHYLIKETSMKNQLINLIIQDMSTDLNHNQIRRLRKVLSIHLSSFSNIQQISFVSKAYESENQELIQRFLSSKQLEGCSQKTLHYYSTTINTMIKKIQQPVTELQTDDLRNYLSDYQTLHKSSRVTIDNIRRIFSSFFSWLEDEEYILKSPVRCIHRIKTSRVVKDVFSDEDIELLRENCANPRDLAMLDLLLSTGIRVGELVNLNVPDINFEERQCVVLGKGNHERVVYFDAKTKLHLQEYLNMRNDENQALFVSFRQPYQRLTIAAVELRLKQIGKKSNVENVHPHKFRRTLATVAIDKGMPVEQVQKLLGHIRIDTTMHYAMVNEANVKNSHRKFIG